MLIVEGGTKLKPSKTTCYVQVILSQVVSYYTALNLCVNVVRIFLMKIFDFYTVF